MMEMNQAVDLSNIDFAVEPDDWIDVAALREMYHPFNSQTRDDYELTSIQRSIQKNGFTGMMIVVNRWNGKIVSGHGKVEACFRAGYRDKLPVVWREYKGEIEHRNAMLQFNMASGHQDPEKQRREIEALLAVLPAEEVKSDLAITPDELQRILGLAVEVGSEGEGSTSAGLDTEPEIDKAEELRKKWNVETGQLWQLDSGKGHPHRLICGDCTDRAVVDRLMKGEKAVLCLADPPYGMGKEKDGIANDNLYRDKLDAFQMTWWDACRSFLADNGSAYIWGNAEDLWRLWYVGGLRDSERLTLRNEIVWDKGSGQGMKSDAHRMYPTASERCLFFMLGEQGFNNNADMFWDGWETIRAYLDSERIKLEWNNKKVAGFFGFHPSMADHWFNISQWSFLQKEQYERLQKEAKGAAFKREYDDLKREYDDLKREFYATRAHFDNTHDGMTDVWQFPRVTGDARYGHATPKPMSVMERMIKSSAPLGGVVCSPFGGTGTDLIACENLNRQCRAVEISPAYCAVILERFFVHTGVEPRIVA